MPGLNDQVIRLQFSSDFTLPLDLVEPVCLLLDGGSDDDEFLLLSETRNELGSLAGHVISLGTSLLTRGVSVDSLEIRHPVLSMGVQGHILCGLADLCFCCLPELQSLLLGADAWVLDRSGSVTRFPGAPLAEANMPLTPCDCIITEVRSQLGWGLPPPEKVHPEQDAREGDSAPHPESKHAKLASQRDHADRHGWGMRLLQDLKLQSGPAPSTHPGADFVRLDPSSLGQLSLALPSLQRLEVCALFSSMEDLSALECLLGLRELKLNNCHRNLSLNPTGKSAVESVGRGYGLNDLLPQIPLNHLPPRLHTLELRGFELMGCLARGGISGDPRKEGRYPSQPTSGSPILQSLCLWKCAGVSFADGFKACTLLGRLLIAPTRDGDAGRAACCMSWGVAADASFPSLNKVELCYEDPMDLSVGLPNALPFLQETCPALRSVTLEVGPGFLPDFLAASHITLQAEASKKLCALLGKSAAVSASLLESARRVECEASTGGYMTITMPLGRSCAATAGDTMDVDAPHIELAEPNQGFDLCEDGDASVRWGWDNCGASEVALLESLQPSFPADKEIAGDSGRTDVGHNRDDWMGSSNRAMPTSSRRVNLNTLDSPALFLSLGNPSAAESVAARVASNAVVSAAKERALGDTNFEEADPCLSAAVFAAREKVLRDADIQVPYFENGVPEPSVQQQQANMDLDLGDPNLSLEALTSDAEERFLGGRIDVGDMSYEPMIDLSIGHAEALGDLGLEWSMGGTSSCITATMHVAQELTGSGWLDVQPHPQMHEHELQDDTIPDGNAVNFVADLLAG